MGRPLMLDLFCGAGGAAVGYDRAGFEVVGVDIVDQPRYPFRFVREDALSFLRREGRAFDAAHASPPCQEYTHRVKQLRSEGHTVQHPDLVGVTRRALEENGIPWVLENIPSAPMTQRFLLCGTYFGLLLYRHRHFDSSHTLLVPAHRKHQNRCAPQGRVPESDEVYMTITGSDHQNLRFLQEAKRRMGVEWMGRGKEVAQAIPPAYTEFAGLQVMTWLGTSRGECEADRASERANKARGEAV